ncbi:serine/arginine-rich splicing factor SR45-like [Miscanthus floridulus]|uniref:serine/arginine-rich splicing factor SR45-like n=1 Tax=Miscanthus floridulus TaxID=154761 RepID=UPI003458F5F4
MRSIRRELQRRRSKPLAPARSVAKKPSVSPPPRHGSSDAVRGPCPPRLPRQEVPSSTISHSRGSTVTDASPQPRSRSSSRCTRASPPPRPLRSDPSSAGSAFRATPRVPAQLKPGTVVRVRTRTAKLKTGQVLVLCLKATIVSSSTDGGYEVVYDANLPRGDPKSTVHVAPHQVRVIDPSPSPTTLPPSLPPPTATVAATTKKEMPRPTTAGKSLRLIRRLFPEMELPVRA